MSPSLKAGLIGAAAAVVLSLLGLIPCVGICTSLLMLVLYIGVGVLVATTVIAGLTLRWAQTNLGGVSGDVLGATNELARVAGLHAGVVAWTLS